MIKQGTQLENLAQNRLDDSFDAVPVPVGKELLLRGHQAVNRFLRLLWTGRARANAH